MKTLALIASIVTVAPLAPQSARAQSTGTPSALSPPSPPAFEVASVRQHPLPRGFLRRFPTDNVSCPGVGHCGIVGNRFTDDVASLRDLIMDAYHVKPYQVTGLPDWGDSGHDIYDINAKAEEGRALTLDQARLMLQTLLADRFQLKLHRESREVPVYDLVIAKGGPKVVHSDTLCANGPGGNRRPLNDGDGRGKSPAPPPGRASGDGGRAAGNATPVPAGRGEELAFILSWEHLPEIISNRAGRPVIDKTGFKGIYCTADGEDPTYAIVSSLGPGGGGRGVAAPPPPDPNTDQDRPSIFTVVQEKLGLKLEPVKGPIDILVIDHVARPSEN